MMVSDYFLSVLEITKILQKVTEIIFKISTIQLDLSKLIQESVAYNFYESQELVHTIFLHPRKCMHNMDFGEVNAVFPPKNQ